MEARDGNVDASINRVWTNACHRLLLLRFQDMPWEFLGFEAVLEIFSIMIHGKVRTLWFIHSALDWEWDQEQWISILCYALYTLH